MSSARTLQVVYETVDERVAAIRDARPAWPCQKGCDDCCRSLAEIPRMTELEWRQLRSSLAALEGTTRQNVMAKIRALTPGQGRVVCPMLDLAEGACVVYDGRPLACRTYGYYVHDRDDKWCAQVTDHLVETAAPHVVMGNEAALERRLSRASGPVRGLDEWIRELSQLP